VKYILLVAMALLILLIFLATDNHKEPAVLPPIAPQSAQGAVAAAKVVPSKPTEMVESAERAHYRHLCENEKYLADRRKLSDFTQQDLDAIRGCKQMGLWER
jgi:hypothetical protein